MARHKKNPSTALAVTKNILLVVATCLFVIIIIRVFYPSTTSAEQVDDAKKRCLGTLGDLSMIRSLIRRYHQKNHRYPQPLGELKIYPLENPSSGIFLADIKEYISNEDGNGNVSNTMDGTGGWYYDKATGDLKINLTKPVRHYLGLTVMADEIPSEW